MLLWYKRIWVKGMLRVEHISVSYGRIQALWDLSLEISGGEGVAIIGANGAGKSTLLKAVMGLLPVQSGSILVDGVPTDGAKPPSRCLRRYLRAAR